MSQVRVCRTCGEWFTPRPGRPGYVDECDDCISERLRPIVRVARPVCKLCGKLVREAGDVHDSCADKHNDSLLTFAKILGLPALLRERTDKSARRLQKPEPLPLTRDEFDELIRLQIKQRWDWPAVFSANEYGDIWPWTRYGWTPDSEREQLRGVSKIIDAVADIYLLRIRPEGGRFFIDDNGAFYKDEASEVVQFVIFNVQDKETIARHHGV